MNNNIRNRGTNVGSLKPLTATTGQQYLNQNQNLPYIPNPNAILDAASGNYYTRTPKNAVYDPRLNRYIDASASTNPFVRLGQGFVDMLSPVSGAVGLGTWDLDKRGHRWGAGPEIDQFGNPAAPGTIGGTRKRVQPWMPNESYNPNAPLESQKAYSDHLLKNSFLGNLAGIGLGKVAQIGDQRKMAQYLAMAQRYGAAAAYQGHLLDVNQMQQFVKSDYGQAKIADMYADAVSKRRNSIAAQQIAANQFGTLGLPTTNPYPVATTLAS